jgi:hypothetical protein
MNITIIKTTENPDGSADCLVRFDAEGLGFLVQEGVLAILKQYIEQCKKEAQAKTKTKAKNVRKKNTRS